MGLVGGRLVWKLLATYLLVILVGGLVLGAAVRVVTPPAFERHMGVMVEGGDRPGVMMMRNLLANFRTVLNNVLLLAALAAVGAATILSAVLAQQVVKPVREMMLASRRIAEGHYEQRVYTEAGSGYGDGDELDELAHSFNQMAEQLEQTEHMRRELLADVSHELRTPLTAIKGSMEGLIDGVLPANEETFQDIFREADRLQRLVTDLEELSRVEAGVFALSLQPTSLNSLAKTLKKRLGKQFAEKGIELEVDIPAELPLVNADEDRCMQVLLNLSGNALQYTPSGGKVRVSAARTGGEVQIMVSDTGVGIPAEHLPNLFQRFYRVDKSRARSMGGSGIGLTIAKHLVEAQGGRIWAESAGAGKGSTFYFALPVTR